MKGIVALPPVNQVQAAILRRLQDPSQARLIRLRHSGASEALAGLLAGGDRGVSTPSDHGLLGGLADDDHTQYHNDTRGDARYYTEAEVNSTTGPSGASLVGVEDANGHYTGADVEAILDEIGNSLATIPADISGASFITVSSEAGLSGESVLTAGAGILLAAGAGTLTVASSNPWTLLVKSGDTSRTNNTLAADPDLQFSAAASSEYIVRGRIYYTSAATPDFKWTLLLSSSAGAGGTGVHKWIIPDALTTLVTTSNPALPSQLGIAILQASGTTGGYIEFEYRITTNGAATISFAWAQNTTNATAATVQKGSYLEYRKVS